MDAIVAQLEAAASAAESSSVDPLVTVRNLVAEVRKAAADLKASHKPEDDEDTRAKGRKSK